MSNTSSRILIIFLILTMSAGYISCKRSAEKEESTKVAGEYNAVLTNAPHVPPQNLYKRPEKVIVEMEVNERVKELADGVEYNFWMFGDEVPGPFIRIQHNDVVEFFLSNHPSNKLPHNIDLHAVTGPGGGAESSMTAPGHTSQFTFRALNPGLYIYHCATAPVGMHIANGMYGLILVEPREGLPPVDKEFYIMQSEFYTTEKFGKAGRANFDMQKAISEEPEYVVFNGSVGANLGDNALQVNVGETVRLYVGNAGPNLVSSFHVIGEIFDKVYVEGGSLINENVQSTVIPAGGAAIVEFKCEVPGSLTLVDHSIFRAFNKGALAQINVVGEENPDVFTGKQNEMVYLPEGSAIEDVDDEEEEDVAVPERSFDERMTKGKSLYEVNCASCHGVNGQGMEGIFPPLANSDYLMERPDKGAGIIINGLSGEIVVNGVTYNSVMPKLQLNDDEIASVLTYVRNSWGNDGELVTAGEVRNAR